MKIVDYKIVSDTSPVSDLEKRVLSEILKGWQPLGGIFVVIPTSNADILDACGTFYQAMVRYED